MTKARECGQKVQYRTRTEARSVVSTIRRQTLATRLHEYRCRFCGFWHFGHRPRRRFQR